MQMVKIIGVVIFVTIAICLFSLAIDKNRYGQWGLQSHDTISWNRFYWVGDSVGGKYYDKAAMFVPAKISGLDSPVTFQLDLGAGFTVLYENTLKTLSGDTYRQVSGNIRRLKNSIQFWNSKAAYKDLEITFDTYSAFTPNCYIMSGFGQPVSNDSPIHIGTIGADMFQNKILIIDYPKEKYCVCDKLPKHYNVKMSSISLDAVGRVILPMYLRNKTYRVLFDNGSSIFPLITKSEKINDFSNSRPIDTILVSSWGEEHAVVGRPLNTAFILAGKNYSTTSIYADYRLIKDDNFDAIAGNVLFWNNTVIIDFKNKLFGMM